MSDDLRMKLTRNRLIAGVLGLMALAFGVVGVQAATSPSTSSKNYAQVFVDRLAGILGLPSSKVQTDLKQAELQTIDQMVKDGVITQAQAVTDVAGVFAALVLLGTTGMLLHGAVRGIERKVVHWADRGK